MNPYIRDLKQLGRRRSPYSIEELKLEFETQYYIPVSIIMILRAH